VVLAPPPGGLYEGIEGLLEKIRADCKIETWQFARKR
jgi:hypothetical protein